MILPLLSTGLKIFQATRKKASSGSDVASNITSRQTTVKGKSVAEPKLIIKAKSNKISATKFLQTTPDPSKSKATSKGGIFEAFASIINTINKFLSNILSTLIADNKLTKTESDDERKKLALVVKRQRESNLEKDGGETTTTTKTKTKSKGSFLDRIIKFITSIAIGALVLAVYQRFTDIIKFFKDTYEVIKGFFSELGKYMSPLLDIFKFIFNISSPLIKIRGDDESGFAKKIEKEDADINKTLDEGGVESGESESTDDLLAAILEEDKENLQASNIFDRALNFFMPPAEAGTLDGKPIREDRSFAKEMIKRHEGLSLRAYKDTKGFLTVGYGHKIDADSPEDIRKLKEGDLITRERAVQLFEFDFNDNLNAAQKIPGFFKATKKQQAALIDLTFNMGPNFLDNFPMMGEAIKEGDFKEAARQLEFADPDNRPGIKSGYVQDVGPRRSDPILNLLQDEGVKDFIHLQDIMNQIGDQSSNIKILSDDLMSFNPDEIEDESIVIPIPKPKTKVVGGSGGGQMIVMGGDDVNSTMKQILHNKLRAL